MLLKKGVCGSILYRFCRNLIALLAPSLLVLAVVPVLFGCTAATTLPTEPTSPAEAETVAATITPAVAPEGVLPESQNIQPDVPDIRVFPPAIHEKRFLTLEWPPVMRAGDSDVVRLTLEVDDQGNLTPTAEIEGHETRGQTVLIPNLYDTHSVFAEAQLEISGLEISPAGPVDQSLRPGEAVTFYWSVRAAEVGSYRGTVWLKLRFFPLVEGQVSERTISAQVIDVEVQNLFGIGGSAARLMGGVGAVIGSMFGLQDIVKTVLGAMKKPQSKRSRSRRR